MKNKGEISWKGKSFQKQSKLFWWTSAKTIIRAGMCCKNKRIISRLKLDMMFNNPVSYILCMFLAFPISVFISLAKKEWWAVCVHQWSQHFPEGFQLQELLPVTLQWCAHRHKEKEVRPVMLYSLLPNYNFNSLSTQSNHSTVEFLILIRWQTHKGVGCIRVP